MKTCTCRPLCAHTRLTGGCPLHDPFLRDGPEPNFVGLQGIVDDPCAGVVA